MPRTPINPTAILSNSSQALQTRKELEAAQARIEELEQELANRQNVLAQVPAELRTQDTVLITSLKRREYKSRKERDPQTFKDLVNSIKTHGFRGSIWVQKLPDGSLKIIAGETRTDAALEAGLSEIRADIIEVDDLTAAKLCRAENARRKNLNELDDTEEMIHLLSLELQKKREEVISLLYQYKNSIEGKASLEGNTKTSIERVFQENAPNIAILTFITKRMRLLNLPADVLEAYHSGKLAYTKAIELAKITDEDKRRDILRQAIQEDLSLSEIKALAKTKESGSQSHRTYLAKVKTQIEKIDPQKAQTAKEKAELRSSLLALEAVIQQKRQELDQE